MDDVTELMSAYSERFNDCFPIYQVYGKPDEEICGIIKDALKTGIPFEPEIEPDTDY